MITPEKLSWIKKNLRYGDRMKINDLVPEASYTEVAAILQGLLWGEHGEIVINVATEFINKRLAKEKEESEKYSDLLSS
jgi:hypothetical protein